MPDPTVEEALESKRKLDRWTRFWTKVVVVFVMVVTTSLAGLVLLSLVSSQHTLNIIEQISGPGAAQRNQKSVHDIILCLDNHVDVIVRGSPELPQCSQYDR